MRITERFNSKCNKFIRAIDDFFQCFWSGKPLCGESLATIENHVSGDIDMNRICNQLGMLINFRQSDEDDKFRDSSTSEIIKKLGHSSLSKIIPQVVDLARLFV